MPGEMSNYSYLKDLPIHIKEEIEAAKPSSDPKYWAKSNCKHCYGRGVEGTIVTKFGTNNSMRNSQICSCVTKAWNKWQEKFLETRKNKTV